MQLFKEINASGTTVIIATHDTGLVDALQTRVVELRDGNIARDSKGGYSAAKAPLKKVVSAATDKKKVKITALRS